MKILNNLYLVLFFAVSISFGCLSGMEGGAVSAAEPPLFEVQYEYDEDLDMVCKIANYNSAAGILTDKMLCQEARKEYLADIEVLVIRKAPSLQSITDPWSGVVCSRVIKDVLSRELGRVKRINTGCWWTTLKKLELFDCPSLTALNLDHFGSLEVLSVAACPILWAIPETIPDLSNLSALKLLTIESCPMLRAAHITQLPEGLVSLWLECCKGISVLPDMSNLRLLTSLRIDNCPIATINARQLPQALEVFSLEDSRRITLLSGMSELRALKWLFIFDCNRLETIDHLPERLDGLLLNGCPHLSGIFDTSTIKDINIRGCPLLGPDRTEDSLVHDRPDRESVGMPDAKRQNCNR